MATQPTPQENANTVLDIYAHFKSRPGSVLRANNFLAVAARRHIPTSYLQDGLDYAAEMNWIEETETGLRLTDHGYNAMPQIHHSY